VENKRPSLLDYRVTSDIALLAALAFNNPELSAKQVLQLYGLKKAFEIVNPRELRVCLANLVIEAGIDIRSNYFQFQHLRRFGS
jgi:hypothetical protein